jgi:hypothetical protein
MCRSTSSSEALHLKRKAKSTKSMRRNLPVVGYFEKSSSFGYWYCLRRRAAKNLVAIEAGDVILLDVFEVKMEISAYATEGTTMRRHLAGRGALVSAFLVLIVVPAKADLITEFTTGTSAAATIFGGQSVTTPSGGPWDDLSFNFFSNVPPTTPSATGELFLLSSAYTGTPSGLSTSTPGFIAESASISGGVYFFAPSLTIQPGTQYFLYPNAAVSETVSPTGGYSGGIGYFASGSTSDYGSVGGDANFKLSGTTVPEPNSVILLVTGIAMAGSLTRRKLKMRRAL